MLTFRNDNPTENCNSNAYDERAAIAKTCK